MQTRFPLRAGIVAPAVFLLLAASSACGEAAVEDIAAGRGRSLTITDLAIDPRTPSSLYAATYFGVFKSMDGGGTWSPVNTGLAPPGD